MFIGIEQMTDHRDRDTKIVRLSTLAKAQKWLAATPAGFAYPGAADPRLPMDAQNFHRRFREVYEMPPGWRLVKSRVQALYDAGRWHHTPWTDCKASLIAREATRRIDEG